MRSNARMGDDQRHLTPLKPGELQERIEAERRAASIDGIEPVTPGAAHQRREDVLFVAGAGAAEGWAAEASGASKLQRRRY